MFVSYQDWPAIRFVWTTHLTRYPPERRKILSARKKQRSGGEEAFSVGSRCAELAGFSLHANTSYRAEQRQEIEELCRYLMRPRVAESRLSLTPSGDGVQYHFKRPWSNGTQAVEFTGREFIEKLVALIPPPRMHLVRFHGALAPHRRLRSRVVPSDSSSQERTTNESAGAGAQAFERVHRKRVTWSWSELLKRVFRIDLLGFSSSP